MVVEPTASQKAVALANWTEKRARFSVKLISLSHSTYITFCIIMRFRNSCHMPFRKLMPPFYLTTLYRGWFVINLSHVYRNVSGWKSSNNIRNFCLHAHRTAW